MRVEVRDLLDEHTGVPDMAGHPLEAQPVVRVAGNIRGKIPEAQHPLILEDPLSLAVDDQNPIERRIDLGFEEGGLPEQLLLNLPALGDVAGHSQDGGLSVARKTP